MVLISVSGELDDSDPERGNSVGVFLHSAIEVIGLKVIRLILQQKRGVRLQSPSEIRPGAGDGGSESGE